MSDSDLRTGILIWNENMTKLFCGRAKNRKDLNGWDIPKGHISKEEVINNSFKKAMLRELYEETGHSDYELKMLFYLGTFDYSGKDDFYLFQAIVPNDQCEGFLETSKCSTYFDWYGNKLPEFTYYKWIPVEELESKLYKSVYKLIKPIIRGLE